MTRDLTARAQRALKKPPHVIARRLADEFAQELERIRAPRRAARTDIATVLAATGDGSLEDAWGRLAALPYPAWTQPLDSQTHPAETERVLAAAADVLARRVHLLGSGPVDVGRPVDWLTDFKTGRRWTPAFHRSIEYANLDEPSDVKVPWELSRLQWAIPAGQAYLLTGDEQYAQGVRELIEEWIDGNPHGRTVNWSCTMDVALRVLSWTWFFHVFNASDAWSDTRFRSRFLTSLFLHGDFISRNLERSEVNGNHYTADAAGLVFVGLFFGRGSEAETWHRSGWAILEDELPRQVFQDGVDYEASTAYHRLVAELFVFPALYRERRGLATPAAYRERLEAMGRFAAAYTRPDGSTPYWGDDDDGRALPFGGQDIRDHRYLPVLLGAVWGNADLAHAFPGLHAELLWALGPDRAVAPGPATARRSIGFPAGGFYVLQTSDDHVFVDCGPIGLAGRGGHGHNDCLALEAWLGGHAVLTDAGAYLYTASPEWRNRFRSTALHNTPQVDGEEQNRFVRDDWLWSLHDDAVPDVRAWEPESGRLVVSHSGYARLPSPVVPVRTVELDPHAHRLTIDDSFGGSGKHMLRVPYHLAPGATAEPAGPGAIRVQQPDRTLRLSYGSADDWSVAIEESWISPSYGIKLPRCVVVFRREGALRPLHVMIEIEQPS